MSVILYALAGLLLICLIAGAAVALRVTWRLTHPERKPVDMDPKDFGINHVQSVQFESREKHISLAGWYLCAEQNGCSSNGKLLIFAHGYSQNRLEPHLPALSLAAKLLDAGFDVFMFDFRNAGDSSDSLTTIGLREQQDLLGAIDYAASVHPEKTIGLVGFSMGAATALLVGGEDARIRAIVADSPFYSLQEYLEENLPQWTGLPRFPFNWFIMTLSPILLGANPRHVKPYKAVKLAEKPIFLIHGTNDATIPTANSERLYSLATDSHSALWLVPDAGHVRSYALVPDEYASRVIAFLEKGMQKKQLR
ncbi:alpha/beta hydrolase [Brevibacillus sp. NRS-1366]|uniref:alpha/beta hydrolase n=1 Tax=Brevibacillus sp. NRS-1366 TaxID=3233899 RepID=UPI003D219043